MLLPLLLLPRPPLLLLLLWVSSASQQRRVRYLNEGSRQRALVNAPPARRPEPNTSLEREGVEVRRDQRREEARAALERLQQREVARAFDGIRDARGEARVRHLRESVPCACEDEEEEVEGL